MFLMVITDTGHPPAAGLALGFMLNGGVNRRGYGARFFDRAWLIRYNRGCGIFLFTSVPLW